MKGGEAGIPEPCPSSHEGFEGIIQMPVNGISSTSRERKETNCGSMEIGARPHHCVPHTVAGYHCANSNDTYRSAPHGAAAPQNPRDIPTRQVLRVLYSASIELASPGKFFVKFSGYHEELVKLFREFAGCEWDRRSMQCSFSVDQYIKVVEVLRNANDRLKAVTLKVQELDIIPRSVLSAAASLQDETERYACSAKLSGHILLGIPN